MNRYQRIADKDNNTLYLRELYYKLLGHNSLKSAEALIILNMINFINKSMLRITFREIMVINNNRMVHKDIISEQDKIEYYANNRAALTCKMKEIV